MQWIDSSRFQGVVVLSSGGIEFLPQRETPFHAYEDIRKRFDGLTFIRNERGASCFPAKALKYFERRAKERPRTQTKEKQK